MPAQAPVPRHQRVIVQQINSAILSRGLSQLLIYLLNCARLIQRLIGRRFILSRLGIKQSCTGPRRLLKGVHDQGCRTALAECLDPLREAVRGPSHSLDYGGGREIWILVPNVGRKVSRTNRQYHAVGPEAVKQTMVVE